MLPHLLTDPPKHVLCRYVSESEYGVLSSYMTQRLPLSKVQRSLAPSNFYLAGTRQCSSWGPTVGGATTRGTVPNADCEGCGR